MAMKGFKERLSIADFCPMLRIQVIFMQVPSVAQALSIAMPGSPGQPPETSHRPLGSRSNSAAQHLAASSVSIFDVGTRTRAAWSHRTCAQCATTNDGHIAESDDIGTAPMALDSETTEIQPPAVCAFANAPAA
jgi:hypothetical protein